MAKKISGKIDRNPKIIKAIIIVKIAQAILPKILSFIFILTKIPHNIADTPMIIDDTFVSKI